jgi:hypothetical protein
MLLGPGQTVYGRWKIYFLKQSHLGHDQPRKIKGFIQVDGSSQKQRRDMARTFAEIDV